MDNWRKLLLLISLSLSQEFLKEVFLHCLAVLSHLSGTLVQPNTSVNQDRIICVLFEQIISNNRQITTALFAIFVDYLLVIWDCLRIICRIIFWLFAGHFSLFENYLSVISGLFADYFWIICRLLVGLFVGLFAGYLRLFAGLFVGYLWLFVGLFSGYLQIISVYLHRHLPSSPWRQAQACSPRMDGLSRPDLLRPGLTGRGECGNPEEHLWPFSHWSHSRMIHWSVCRIVLTGPTQSQWVV